MSLPTAQQDTVGNVVTATDLGIAIGTVIGNSANVVSNNITTPAAVTCVLLLSTNATGTCTAVLDIVASGTPSFSSGAAVTTTFATSVAIGGVINTTLAAPVVGVKISNSSGASVTVNTLRLLVLGNINTNKQDWHTIKSSLNALYGKHNPAGSGIGTFVLNT